MPVIINTYESSHEHQYDIQLSSTSGSNIYVNPDLKRLESSVAGTIYSTDSIHQHAIPVSSGTTGYALYSRSGVGLCIPEGSTPVTITLPTVAYTFNGSPVYHYHKLTINPLSGLYATSDVGRVRYYQNAFHANNADEYVKYGVIEQFSGSNPVVSAYINNSGTDNYINSYSSSVNAVDIASLLSGTGLKTITLNTSDNCRIAYLLQIKVDMDA